MTHTLIEIVKDSIAFISHVCEGKVYYTIEVDDSVYQLELDSMDDDWKATHIKPRFKAVTLMRWIRKGMEENNETFIQLK
jgi:hypothetical protein